MPTYLVPAVDIRHLTVPELATTSNRKTIFKDYDFADHCCYTVTNTLTIFILHKKQSLSKILLSCYKTLSCGKLVAKQPPLELIHEPFLIFAAQCGELDNMAVQISFDSVLDIQEKSRVAWTLAVKTFQRHL